LFSGQKKKSLRVGGGEKNTRQDSKEEGRKPPDGPLGLAKLLVYRKREQNNYYYEEIEGSKLLKGDSAIKLVLDIRKRNPTRKLGNQTETVVMKKVRNSRHKRGTAPE